MAEIILLLNALIYIVLEAGIVMKARKMPVPEDYPPKSWDWFQRWVESKYFWWELLAFIVVISIVGWIACV